MPREPYRSVQTTLPKGIGLANHETTSVGSTDPRGSVPLGKEAPLKRISKLLILVFAMALIAAACAGTSDDTTTTTAAEGGTDETTTTAAAETTTTTTVAPDPALRRLRPRRRRLRLRRSYRDAHGRRRVHRRIRPVWTAPCVPAADRFRRLRHPVRREPDGIGRSSARHSGRHRSVHARGVGTW